MAVDTRNKRASAIGIGLIWRSVLPQPDGNMSSANRRQLAYCYPIVDDVGSFGCVPAQQSFMPGARALDHYHPGAQALQLYRPGAVAIEKAC